MTPQPGAVATTLRTSDVSSSQTRHEPVRIQKDIKVYLLKDLLEELNDLKREHVLANIVADLEYARQVVLLSVCERLRTNGHL